MDVYGATSYVDALDGTHLRLRLHGQKQEQPETAPALPPPQNDPLSYLVAVLQHRLDPGNDLSSLPTNVSVVQILDAARRSAATGATERLAP
jgi:hypothetical protein